MQLERMDGQGGVVRSSFGSHASSGGAMEGSAWSASSPPALESNIVAFFLHGMRPAWSESILVAWVDARSDGATGIGLPGSTQIAGVERGLRH